MNTQPGLGFEVASGEGGGGPAEAAARFYAMDCVRATAMLLGVFYHLPIAMTGGFGMGASPKTAIDHWLHSFRMALFFLIAGFFANMVLRKYGMGRFLMKRLWRIGAPLAAAIFLFAGLRITQQRWTWVAPPIGGMMGGGFGFGAPPPFVMPAAGAGAPGADAQGRTPATPPPLTTPGARADGPAAGPAPFPMPPMPMAGMQMPGMPSRALADRWFGSYSRFFNLEHLWFLWYLLVFSLLGALAAMGLGRVVGVRPQSALDRFGSWLTRHNLMPLALALASLPALFHARGIFGWSLTNPIGFSAPFPDFVYQYYADGPFYLIYFLTGWWFYRFRDGLDAAARPWLWNLTLGVAAHAASQALSNRYAMQPAVPPEWARLAGFALYSAGAAYSGFGMLGLFQRFLNRPTRFGKYFTDTILWVYLVQLALIPYLIGWIEPWRSSWWEATLGGMVVVVGAALVLFELFIRPTPLVHIFGPASLSRPQWRAGTSDGRGGRSRPVQAEDSGS